MNDQFLRRMRVEPPPEFLAALKARLDRQVMPPAPKPRPSIVRILVAALLIGGTAFAIGSLAIRGIPTVWRGLSSTSEPASSASAQAPGHSHETPPTLDAHARAKSASEPLAGAFPWRTTHSHDPPEAPASREKPDAGAEVAAHAPSSNDTTIARQATLVPPDAPRDYITIVGSAAVYPYTAGLAENLTRTNRSFKLPKITVDSNRDGLDLLCAGGSDSPDIAEVSRRITPQELQTCAQNGVGEVVEIKLGYEAVVLVRSKLYGALQVTPRDVFLAFAKQIPDPDHPQSLIKNPNTTWNQVNPSLPYDRIELFGPPLKSGLGAAFVDLLVEAGCNTYPWLAALGKLDETRYEEVCHTVRDDGPYVVVPELYLPVTKLEMNPTALGLTNLGTLTSLSGQVEATWQRGVAPTLDNIASHTYPSRTLYLYVNKAHVDGIPYLNWFLQSYLRALDIPDRWRTQPPAWALTPPPEAERRAIRANLSALNSLKF